MNVGLHTKEITELIELARIKDRRSFRMISLDLGLSPSTFTRIRRGKSVTSDSLLLILDWAHLVTGEDWNAIMYRVIERI